MLGRTTLVGVLGKWGLRPARYLTSIYEISSQWIYEVHRFWMNHWNRHNLKITRYWRKQNQFNCICVYWKGRIGTSDVTHLGLWSAIYLFLWVKFILESFIEFIWCFYCGKIILTLIHFLNVYRWTIWIFFFLLSHFW